MNKIVMTLTNNSCDCVETGECVCNDLCMCDCECYDCSVEMISDCISGNGQCLCMDDD